MSLYTRRVPKLLAVYSTLLILFFSCKKENSTRGANRADISRDVQYATNTDIDGATVNLKMDVYVPKNAGPAQFFPLILYVHGGGFSEGDKSDAQSFMLKYVDAGFVAVSINYRLMDEDAGNACNADTLQTKYSSYMAVQDTKAALRYIVANASTYHINVSNLFISGNSAGAVTVLNTAYLSQNDFNKIIPGVESLFGSLNNSGNSLTNTFTIRGIAANSGCLPDPSYITASNVVPMILFHGGKDNVIPVDKGHTYGCSNTQFVYGSESLYARASKLETAVVAHIDPNGEHLPYSQNFLSENETCFFNSIMNKTPQSGYYTGNASSCQ